MRLATIRTPEGHRAVRVGATVAVETGDVDVRALLEQPDWPGRAAAAAGREHPVDGLDLAPLVPTPEKIICVGLNYRDHVLEMGNQLPSHPTLFAKYPPALVGAHDDIELPAESDQIDWEAELAVVVGLPGRHLDENQAAGIIAGYSVLNDVSMRDWQNRTKQFLQGKTWEHSTPLGPYLVTPDELPAGGWPIGTTVDGEVVQQSSTDQLVFGPAALVSYVSTILTLKPGDVIATGTPGGVGHARTPPRYLTDGAEVVTTIGGIGECRNRCRAATRVAVRT